MLQEIMAGLRVTENPRVHRSSDTAGSTQSTGGSSSAKQGNSEPCDAPTSSEQDKQARNNRNVPAPHLSQQPRASDAAEDGGAASRAVKSENGDAAGPAAKPAATPIDKPKSFPQAADMRQNPLANGDIEGNIKHYLEKATRAFDAGEYYELKRLLTLVYGAVKILDIRHDATSGELEAWLGVLAPDGRTRKQCLLTMLDVIKDEVKAASTGGFGGTGESTSNNDPAQPYAGAAPGNARPSNATNDGSDGNDATHDKNTPCGYCKDCLSAGGMIRCTLIKGHLYAAEACESQSNTAGVEMFLIKACVLEKAMGGWQGREGEDGSPQLLRAWAAKLDGDGDSRAEWIEKLQKLCDDGMLIARLAELK